MDFVRRVRFENEVKANDDKEEEKNNNIISTQELIEDARERRISKKTHFECTECVIRCFFKVTFCLKDMAHKMQG